MVEHPNAVLVRRLVTALTAQDRSEIEAVLAEGCVWRVPGHNMLSGEYCGRGEILRLFGKMKRIFTGPAQFEIIDVAASDARAVIYQYGVVTVGSSTVRLKECLVYRVADGQVHEVDEFQYDMDAFDEAFSEKAVAEARAEHA